jgi:hypothetical protein
MGEVTPTEKKRVVEILCTVGNKTFSERKALTPATVTAEDIQLLSEDLNKIAVDLIVKKYYDYLKIEENTVKVSDLDIVHESGETYEWSFVKALYEYGKKKGWIN